MDVAPFIPEHFRNILIRAEDSYAYYKQSGDIFALNLAIEGWEQVYTHHSFSKAEPDFRIAVLSTTGHLYNEYYLVTQEHEYLSKAIDCFDQVIKLLDPNSEDMLYYLDLLGLSLMEKFELSNDQEDLNAATKVFEKAELMTPKDSPQRSGVLNNLALNLLRQFEITDDGQQWERAIQALEEALSDNKIEPSFRADLQITLGHAMIRRCIKLDPFKRSKRSSHDLETGINILEEAFAHTNPNSPEFLHILRYLDEGLSHRYVRENNISDLDRAIQILEHGLQQLAMAEESMLDYIRVNLALRLKQRHQANKELIDLERAIELWSLLLDKPSLDLKGRFEVLDSLADAMVERYEQKKDFNDLQKAIESHQEAIEMGVVNSPKLEYSLNRLGYALTLRYQFLDDEADLNLAIDILEKATSQDTPFMFSGLGTLAAALRLRYESTNDLADLNRSIDLYRQALREDYLGLIETEAKNNLATNLMSRYEITGDESNVKDAVAIWEELADSHKIHDATRSTILNNLSSILMTRQKLTHDLADHERAMRLNEEALSLAMPDSSEKASGLRTSAKLLIEHYELVNDEYFLIEGISAFEEALKITPKDSPFIVQLHSDLSLALITLYQEKGNPNDLERAISLLEDVIEKTYDNSPKLLDHLSHFSMALKERFQLHNNPADWDMVVKYQERVVLETPKGSIDLPMRMYNLGIILSQDYQDNGNEEKKNRAIAYFRQAATASAEPEMILHASCLWGDLAMESQSWDEAVVAYNQAQQVSEQIFQAQVSHRNKSISLENSQGLTANLAYALAKTGNLQKAVLVLENGSARLLSQGVEQNRRDLENLNEMGHTDLYEQYKRAHLNWSRLAQMEQEHDPGGFKGLVPSTILQSARAELDAIIDSIRELPGYESFLRDISFSEIQTAASRRSLIYIFATTAGGLALIVSSNTVEVIPIWLDGLTTSALKAALIGDMKSHESVKGYIGAYLSYKGFQDESSRSVWNTFLDKTLNWLWNVMMKELISVPDLAREAILIPIGFLNFLPLHAAWTEDVALPNGRRYALDVMNFTYAPKASAVLRAGSITSRTVGDSILAIGEPYPTNASLLPNAPYEVKAAIASFPRHRVLSGEKATREAVLAEFAKYSILHVACHSFADLAEPTNGSMVMAHDEFLCVSDILNLHLSGIRLAVLSACETGMPGLRLPDEVFSLSTGLLQAGVAGVIASLWEVNDIATTMLMFRFYHLWSMNRKSPSDALRGAQIWIKDTTNGEKADYFKRFLPEFGIDHKLSATAEQLYQSIVLRNKESRDFAHPHYWAAFTYSGT